MDLVKVLESYRGKDRVIRLSTYIMMFLGGQGNTPLHAKLNKIAAELSACRVVLRLFDDFSTLMHNLSNGFGLKEPNPVLRPLEIVGAVLGQLYYPVEHIVWLHDKAILSSGNVSLYRLATVVVWALTVANEIVKCAVKLRINARKMYRLKKQKHLEKSEDREENSQQTQEIQNNLRKLQAEQKDLVLIIIQSAADLTNAISWLPKGFLWSQKLSPSANGLLGIIATIIMLFRNWPSH